MRNLITSNFFKCFIVCLLLLVSFGNTVHADDGKDLILVLDTSLSMVGQGGGKNILPQVKQSLTTFIDKLEDGDSLTFITFDTVVKIYPLVEIEDDNDRAILKKYITMVEARGLWTYTYEMLKSIMARAQELQEKDSDRQQVIVIMTDALDDPPPARKKQRLDIKDVAKAYTGKDWFIYFVSLGDVVAKQKIDKFQKNLSKVSPYTKVIDAKGSPKKVLENLDKPIEEMERVKAEREGTFLTNPFFIVFLIVLALVALLWYLQKIAKIKVYGILEYYDHTTFQHDVQTIDLTKYNSKKVTIGRSSEDNVRLRDFESKKPIVFKAFNFDGVIQVVIDDKEGLEVEFLKKKKESFLVDGDSFKADCYTFTFKNSE